MLGGCTPAHFEEKLPVLCCVVVTLLRDSIVSHFNRHYAGDARSNDNAAPKIMDTIKSEGKKIALKDLIAATLIVFTSQVPAQDDIK